MNLGRSPLNLQLLPGELNGAMSALCLISVTLKLLLNVPLLAAPILEHLEEILDDFLVAAMFRFIFWVSFVLEGFRFVINWIFQVGSSFPKKKTWNPLQLVFFSLGLPGVLAPGLLDEGPLLSGHRLPVPLPPR